MIKRDIVVKVARESGLIQKDVSDVLEATFSTILEGLNNGEDIAINGFGKFVVKVRPSRKSTNPKTGESIIVKPRKVVKFVITPQYDSQEK